MNSFIIACHVTQAEATDMCQWSAFSYPLQPHAQCRLDIFWNADQIVLQNGRTYPPTLKRSQPLIVILVLSIAAMRYILRIIESAVARWLGRCSGYKARSYSLRAT